ncbi:MAG TPA: aminotransferase class I/II-fold pyridoxal phosphate-dependent enzyme, partial [Longimicrobiales bacterium]|nr:aminotransferase class I/II-fold pyridoxal phosphate-dependent enzyme [Longimicrobiales bacterium]
HPGLGPDDFLVHAAGVEVLLTVALAVLEPGDHAVIQAPCYQAARSAPQLAGARVSLWSGDPERGWAPELDALPPLLDQPGTRLLVINTPHNPTGHHFTLDELRWILDAAESRGVQVLVDEAYRGAEHRAGDRLPSAPELSDTAGALGLLSKGYGLPGLRLAWLATRNRALMDAVAKVKDYTTICAPAPAEFLGTVALRHSDRILARSRELLTDNLAALEAFMGRHGDRFRWIPPRAGSVCLPLLQEGQAERFCARAREEAGVLLAPGPLFDGHPGAFRVGFGRRGFREGLAVLEGWLARGGGGSPAGA